MKPILIYQPGKVGSITVYNKIKALIIRTENLTTNLNEALTQYLDKPITTPIKNDNAKTCPKPKYNKQFVDQYYNNDFTRHFYTEQEIQEFKQKWTK